MADTEQPDEEMPAAGGAENPNENNPAENAAGTKNEATVIEIRDGAPSEKADGGRAKSTAGGAADKGADVSEDDLRYRSGGQVAKSGLLGAFIGLAIIVPGVSGSAVAIIFRLYEKLLYALGNFFRKFKRCALFLLPVAVGAAVGLILGFFGVRALLGVLPFATVALFAGLMLGARAKSSHLGGAPSSRSDWRCPSPYRRYPCLRRRARRPWKICRCGTISSSSCSAGWSRSRSSCRGFPPRRF